MRRFLKGNGTALKRLLASWLIVFMVMPVSVWANPDGEQVVSGSAAFNRSGSTLEISQGSDSAIIDWQSFSIDVGETTNFLQPSASSAILNRVISNDPSQIFGNLTANGQVFLVNQNGILVGASGVIDTNGFVASTLDVSNEDFLAGGDLTFLGDSSATVMNLGKINAVGGDVLLIARDVQNAGEITATNGTVALAAGSEVLVKASGAERVFIQAGSADGSVLNSGLIDSASAELKALGGNEFALAVNNEGAVRATGVEERGGRIWLVADQSTVENSGSLTATQGDKGGEVQVLGDRVALTGEALIDVSGEQGGGTALIGGDFQGSNVDVKNAAKTFVGADAQINADALVAGDGGKVIVWSDEATQFYGDISAKGGVVSGDGGFVEVSGKGYLDFQGTVDTQAERGEAGTLLLDPYNLTISSGANNNSDTLADQQFDADTSGSVLNVDTLQTALSSGNVMVTTGSTGAEEGDITVADDFGWFSDYNLTLSAADDINLDASIFAFKGDLAMTAGTGSITLGNDTQVSLLDGNLTVTAGSSILQAAVSDGTARGYFQIDGTSSFDAGDSIDLQAADNSLTGAVALTSGGAGSVNLNNDRGTVLGTVSGGSGGVEIVSNGHLTSESVFNSAGDVYLSTASGSAGRIEITTAFSPTGAIYLSADGAGGISIPVLDGDLTFASVSASGAITLGNSATGDLTFDYDDTLQDTSVFYSAEKNVITGKGGSGGQASGVVTIEGSSIDINDLIRTYGGNVYLTSTGTVESSTDITTTAQENSGQTSGLVEVDAGAINLQNITTAGADHNAGIGSGAAFVTLTARAGDINVGGITTDGGDATLGETTNRSGGNASNISLSATSGIIYLNGDVSAIGGSPDGASTYGAGGYVEMASPVVLTANRTINTGATAGNVDFLSTIDSDSTETASRLVVTTGTGDVEFDGIIGGTSALDSLSVTAGSTIDIEKDVSTSGASGLYASASTIRLGDDDLTDGLGAMTIDTSSGSGTVTLNATSTYLDDDVTFTRGTGAINISNYLYSKAGERNDLTFNGADGGAVYVGNDVGGTSDGETTALGDILFQSVTDLTFNSDVSAKSLKSLNGVGAIRIYDNQYYDDATGFLVATDGSATSVTNDQNITIYDDVRLSDATAPLSITASNGTVTTNSDAYLESAGGDITISGKNGVTIGEEIEVAGSGGSITLTSIAGAISTSNSATLTTASGNVVLNASTGITVGYNADVSTSGGDITLTSTTGSITTSEDAGLSTGGGAVSMETAGAITLGEDGVVTTSGGSLALTSTAGTVTTSTRARLTTANGDVSIAGANGISIGYEADISSSAGSIALTSSGGAITTSNYAGLTTTGGNVSIAGANNISIGYDADISSSAGSIVLDSSGGSITTSSYAAFTTTNAAVNFDAATGITLGYDSDITTSGGAITLLTSAGEVAMQSHSYSWINTDINSGNGDITISGIGISQDDDYSTINAGSGKIRIDGGGAQIDLRGSLSTTDADSGDTAAIIIQDAGTSSNAVQVSKITAQNGTLRIGELVGDLASADVDGNVTQLSVGSDKIDVNTLEVNATGSLSITDTDNVIDTLGGFNLGGSLTVQAKGRSAGMALTGDVSATSVTIKTGNGALVLGDRDITSTSGNVFLQGKGVTQSASSVIDSAGTVTIYGSDYASGTTADVTMLGEIVAANTSTNAVDIRNTMALQLTDIIAGDTGSRGGLYIYNINGAVTQAEDTSLQIGTFSSGYQYNGTITLTNADNEIVSLGSIYRGGALSIYDKDSENNDLTISGHIYQGTDTNAIKIETLGDLSTSGSYTIRGQGITLAGTSITSSAYLNSTEGVDGDLVLQANGGDITLTGQLTVDDSGSDIEIRKAADVQLGSYTYAGNSSLVLGQAGTTGTLAASQSVSEAGNLTLNGTSVSEGTAAFEVGERVSIVGSGNDSTVTYTVTGTDMFGRTQTEEISGADAAGVAAEGSLYFSTITQIAASDATAGSVSVGTAVENITGNVTQTGYINTTPSITGLVDGSVTLLNSSNQFAGIGDFTTGGDFNVLSRPYSTLTVTGDVVSTTGDISITNERYNLTVASSGSITAAAEDSQVLLRASNYYSGYDANIQGPVSAGSGGITLSSTYGDVYTSGAGSLSTTGTATINSDDTTNLQAAVDADAGIDINSSYTVTTSGSGTLTTSGGQVTIDSGYNDAISIGAAVSSAAGIFINSGGSFTNTTSGTLTSTGAVTIDTDDGDDATIGGAISAGGSGIDINSGGTFASSGTLTTSAGSITIDSGTYDATSIGAAVSSASAIIINSGGTFTNTSTGTLAADDEITISSRNGYATTIQGAISAGEDGNNNITINSGRTFTNNSTGTLEATGSVAIKTYWDGSNEYNLTLGGDVSAGDDGIRLTSSGAIIQDSGILTTTGTLSGPNQSGGLSLTASSPSARGAITLTGANAIGNLGPFYLYDESAAAFTVNDVSGGLTLAGTIENSHGAIDISTQGGALNLAIYDVYAGGMVEDGANISLSGQGITQAAGSEIITTGGTNDLIRSGENGGGTITLTGHDGTAAGDISLSGGISTINASSSAIKIRGAGDLQLPDITAVNGTLVLGDDTETIGLITGNITQATNTALNVNALQLGTATNAIGGSAVLANLGNKIVDLGIINTGAHQFVDPATDIPYDLDIYDATGGLTLLTDVLSAEGVRIRTTDATAGVLTLGTNSVLASGDISLSGLTVTQADGSTINADNSGTGGIGGSIRIDGGGGANNITLEGTVTTDNSSSTAIEIVNAQDATLNLISASAGTVTLGEDGAELSGAVSQTEATGILSAATLVGDAGSVTINQSNIDNLGPFTASSTMILKDQGGAGTAGLKFTGAVTINGSAWIESSDGLLDLDSQALTQTVNSTLDESDQKLTLIGVGVSQQSDSTILATTADLYGGSGNINLFSTTNDFTDLVTVHSTGGQVSIQDANNLSMNALTGVIDPTTSIQLWAGTRLVLFGEDLTTTSGNIEFKSLGDIFNTPGKLTTDSGNITLYSSTTLSLAEKILSSSGNIDIEAGTIASRAGAEDYIKTAGDGTIDIRATSGNFTQGSDVLYQTVDGDITLMALAGNVKLANIQSTNGGLNVTAGGNILQFGGSAITVDTVDAVTRTDAGGAITLSEATNNVDNIRLRTLNAAGDDAAGGVIQYQDADGFAVQEILTTANTTLTARGNITADAVSGNPGTVKADLFTVKTLLDGGASVELANANDVNTLNIKVRNADDSAIAGETTTPTGTICFTDSDGFVISGIETGGSTVLTAGDAVTQTGAVDSAKLGLSGAGDYTLHLDNSGTPVNQVSTLASDATGNITFTTNQALTIGTVNTTGITSKGANVTISAPSIDSTAVIINTSSDLVGTAGGSLSLTTTGSAAAGDLTVGSIQTSGTNAATDSGNSGGVAGNITLTAAGDDLTVAGVISAVGGSGDGSGIEGADGTVKLTAASGAVSQADGSNEIYAGRVLVDALNSSALLDTDNGVNQLAARITGVGQDFSYRSGSDFAIGGGENGVNGITTQGGAVDIQASDAAVTVSESIVTNGGDIRVSHLNSFDSSAASLSSAGDVTYASGVYKDGGDITITTDRGDISTGSLVASGDVTNAGDATSGAITLTAGGNLAVGTTDAKGKGTGTGGAVTLTGFEVSIGGVVDTSSTGSTGGDITIYGPAVIAGADRFLSTGSTGGNIIFTDTVDSDGTPRGLSLTVGTGNILFADAVGDSDSLGAINIVSAEDVTASDAITAVSLSQQAGTGTTILDGAVNLTGNLSFTGNNLSVNDTIAAGGKALISNAGLFSTAVAGDISVAGGFTQNGIGASELAGDISTTDSNISFATPVTLAGDVAMGTDTGAGNIVFADTLDSDDTARDLTLTSGAGDVTFTGIVGGTALNDLTVNSGGLTKFSAAVIAASVTTDADGTLQVNGGTVTTTGAQTYNDALILGNNTTLAGSTVTANGTLGGGDHSLKIDGDVVFGDEADDTVTGLTTLEVSGATTINTSTITSADAQTYTGAVTLGTDTTLTATDDPILFSSTVDSLASGTKALTVSAGSGNVTFTDAVGGAENGELGALAVNSTGTTLFSSTVEAASVNTNAGGVTEINGGAVTTSGAQTYSDAVTLGADTVLAGVDVTLGGTVKSDGINRSLTVNDSGTTTFGGAIGSTTAGEKLSSLTTDAAGAVQMDGGDVYTTGSQTYNDAVILGAATTLTGSSITTNGMLTGANHSLDIVGNAVLGDEAADSVSGLTTLTVSGLTTIHTGSVTSSGSQDYNDAVTLGEDSNLTASTVTFAAALDSAADASRSLTVTGDAVFSGAVGEGVTGSTTLGKLGNLHVTGASAIDGGKVTSAGAQDYDGAVALGADTTLQGSMMTFGDTLDGTSDATESLTLSGAASFGGDVGAGHALQVLSVNGATMLTDDIGVTASSVAFGGAVDGTGNGTEALTVTGDTAFGGNIGASHALQALSVKGATTLMTDVAVTAADVTFDGTVDGTDDASETLSLTGDTSFGGDVGANHALQALSVNGATTLTTDVAVTATNATFSGTIDGTGDASETLNLTGATSFGADVGANHALAALSVNGATTLTTDVAMTAADMTFVSTIDGTGDASEALSLTGHTSFGDDVGVSHALAALSVDGATTLTADVTMKTTDVAFNGTLDGTTEGEEALSITGNSTFGGAVGADQSLESLSVSGTTAINADTISTTGDQTYTGAVTLGADADLTSGDAINFGSTVDSDADTTPRSLRLTSASLAGQNFVSAVGGTHALDILRIESAGVVTQGDSAPIKAAKLAIKSAGKVILDNAANDIDILAALLSGDAALVFVDADGVEIGTVDSSDLQIVGISDGDGTSNVSITVSGALTQAASSPILLDGNLTIDTTDYNADDVDLKNTAATGTQLGNSLIAGDFTLDSTGDVTQLADANGPDADAFLQVGGSFDINGTGTFIQGNSADNLIGGGSAGSAPNEIRLDGVITLSMVGEDLVASATTTGTGETSTDTILAADLVGGIAVTSDAGGKSISTDVSDGTAVSLGGDNVVAGSIKITTKGTYINSGTAVATGILQSTDLDLTAASFFVQQSTANSASTITGAGQLDLSNAGNIFTGTVSATAIGMDVHLREDTALELGTINAQNVIVELDNASSVLAITQSGTTTITAETLLLQNAGEATLTNANRIGTLAATLNGDLSLTNNQALSVGTANAVDGITGAGQVVLKTNVGDLTLDEGISVTGTSDITLVSAANFINNVGASALETETGQWQIWSTDPSLDTLGDLVPDFKQYNATYGTDAALGTGNGLLYTLSPELTVSLNGSVERVYNAAVDATLTQSNYSVGGLLSGDDVVLSTAASFDTKDVGDSKTISVENVTIDSASNGGVTVYGYQLAAGTELIQADIGSITQAALTLSGIAASNKIYDATTTASIDTAGAVYTGLFDGDSVSVSASGVFSDKNVADDKIVTLTSSYSGADSGNYLITDQATTTADITPATLTLSGITAVDKVYNADVDATISTDSAVFSGLYSGDLVSVSATGTFSDKNVADDKIVTLTSSYSGLDSGNYTIVDQATTTADITPATLTVSGATAQDKVYDQTTSAIITGGSLTGILGSDSVSIATSTGSFDDKNVAEDKSVTASLTLASTDANNYILTQPVGLTASITPKELSLSGITAANKTYNADVDATVSTTDAVYSGLLSGDELLVSATGTFSDKNVADDKIVTLTSSYSGADSGNYLISDQATTTADITPATLTLSGITAVDKVYNADVDATISTDSAVFSGLYSGDLVSVSATGTFSDKNVADDKIVTLTSSYSGLDSGNYSIVDQATTTADITPATLTVSGATAQDKVYDQTTSAIITGGSLTGILGSDSVSIATSSGSFDDKNVAEDKSVTASLTLGSTDANNYLLTQPVGLTASITPKALSLSGITASNKTYNADVAATVSTTDVVYSGLLSGDELLVSATGTFSDKNVADDKIVTLTSSYSGADRGNYLITDQATTTADITPATLTLSGITAVDKVYNADVDATISTDSAVFSGLYSGDLVSVSATGTFSDKNVADDKIVTLTSSYSGLDSGNYSIVDQATTTADITPATLTVSGATAQDKVYDQTTSAIITGGILTGILGSDSVNIATSSGSFDDKNVADDKSVTAVLTLGSTDANNYLLTQPVGLTASITPKELNLSGITASNKIYNADVDATVSTTAAVYSGLLSGDELFVSATGTFSDKNVADDKIVTLTSSYSGADSGNYLITDQATTTADITPATLTLSGITAVDKVYNADVDATISTDSAVFSGLYSGDLVSVSATGTFSDKNVADGKTVTLTSSYSGADVANYTINDQATTSANITKAALEIIANDDSKIYDSVAYSGGNGVTYSGFVAAEDDSVLGGSLSYSGSAQGAVGAGIYTLTPQGLTSGNYEITFSDGSLVVDKAMLTYVAALVEREYGEANPVVSGSLTGFVGTESIADLGGSVTWATPAVLDSDAGSYVINGSGYSSANYDFTQAAGNATAFNINKATLTYAADINTIEYGDADPALSGTVSGFKLGQDTSALGGSVDWVPSSSATSDVGIYGVTGTGYSSVNYNFVQAAVNATALTVEPATLTYTADAIVREYGDANPTLTGTISGLKNGELLSDVTSGNELWMTNASSSSSVGLYPVYGLGLTVTDSNYSVTIEQAAANESIFSITPATLEYVADAVSRQYGNENPVLTGIVSGFKNGESVADLSGSVAWTTPATVMSDLGSYAINGSGYSSGNYIFAQAAANAKALSILATTINVGGQEVAIVNEGGVWQLVDRDDHLILVDSRNSSFVSIDEKMQNYMDDQMTMPQLPLLQQLPTFQIEFEQQDDFTFGNVFSAASSYVDQELENDLGFGAYYAGERHGKRQPGVDYLD